MADGKEWYDAELSMDASGAANQRGRAAAGPAQAERSDRGALFGPAYQPERRNLPARTAGGNRRGEAHGVEYVRAPTG